ncbi:hypothetical protein Hanom_Chr09g00798441 [Helianthus anomalus]
MLWLLVSRSMVVGVPIFDVGVLIFDVGVPIYDLVGDGGSNNGLFGDGWVEGRRQRRRERRRSRSYPDEFMLWLTLEVMGLVGSRLVAEVRRLGGGPAAAPP